MRKMAIPTNVHRIITTKLSPLCVWGVNFEMWNFLIEIPAHDSMANDHAAKGISSHNSIFPLKNHCVRSPASFYIYRLLTESM